MNLQARVGLSLMVVMGLGVHALAASAQGFPSRPLRIIAPVPPGGGVDILSRAVGQKLAENLGVSVIVDNRPGASAVIGTELLAKSSPDGHTLMMGYSAHATNPLLYKLPYDTVKDFAAIAHVGYIPLLLVVHPSVSATSVKELIALAKSRPGQLQFASGGAGGPFFAGVLLKYMTGVDILHVPYKGNAPALVDLLGGQVSMMFDTITTSLPHAKTGRLRMLAVTSAKRASLAPEVLTMAEAGLPGFEVQAWFVMLVPARTPRDIVMRLNAEINKAANDANFRSRMARVGVEFVVGTPEQADAFIRAEMNKWEKAIKATGMTIG